MQVRCYLVDRPAASSSIRHPLTQRGRWAAGEHAAPRCVFFRPGRLVWKVYREDSSTPVNIAEPEVHHKLVGVMQSIVCTLKSWLTIRGLDIDLLSPCVHVGRLQWDFHVMLEEPYNGGFTVQQFVAIDLRRVCKTLDAKKGKE